MNTLVTLIRRELQEHKVGFIYAPFIVTCVLSLVIISVYFGLTDIQTAEFNFTTKIYENEQALEWMATADMKQITAVMRSGLVVLALPILLTIAFAILAFNLSTFADERKDRTLIFWRSLPVSDLTTVMSKILLVTLILPLIVLPNIILLHLISLLSASIFFATNDIVPFGWVWSAYSFTDWFRIIFSLWAQSLWSLPLTAWLMFAGAFAKRPIMGALVPIAVVVVLEGIVLKTNYIFTFIEDRLGFWTRASSFPKQSEELRVVDVSDIYLMLSTQDFWIGMALSTLLIAGIVYFRSRNNDYSSE